MDSSTNVDDIHYIDDYVLLGRTHRWSSRSKVFGHKAQILISGALLLIQFFMVFDF